MVLDKAGHVLSDHFLLSKLLYLSLRKAEIKKDCIGVMAQCRGRRRWWNAMAIDFETQGGQMGDCRRLR